MTLLELNSRGLGLPYQPCVSRYVSRTLSRQVRKVKIKVVQIFVPNNTLAREWSFSCLRNLYSLATAQHNSRNGEFWRRTQAGAVKPSFRNDRGVIYVGEEVGCSGSCAVYKRSCFCPASVRLSTQISAAISSKRTRWNFELFLSERTRNLDVCTRIKNSRRKKD